MWQVLFMFPFWVLMVVGVLMFFEAVSGVGLRTMFASRRRLEHDERVWRAKYVGEQNARARLEAAIESWNKRVGAKSAQAFAEHRKEYTPKTPEFWGVLGLYPPATKKEIESAFRTIAKRVHPDRKGGSAKEFIALIRAREAALAAIGAK